jgi:hypothetical protein
VVQHRDQRQGGEVGHGNAVEHEREPDAGEQDADVLDRREREQALHVGLGRSEYDAVDRAEESERKRRQPPPP